MNTSVGLPIPIPYYTQRVSEGNFQSEGYPTLAEGRRWTARTCGISSLRMVIDGIRQARGETPCPCQAEMLRQGLEQSAYREGAGWIHQGLVELAALWGVEGEAVREKTTADLMVDLAARRPCIASVTPHFAGGEPDETGHPTPRGGHLIVMLGYEVQDGALAGFLTHHPSCFSEYEWPNRWVSRERFAASFSGNYIRFQM